jgi:Lon protease-like protein
MPLRLHIFEERYRLMFQKVMQTNHTFGVNLIRSGDEALGPIAQPFDIGCTARVVQMEPLEDGRFNLTAVGDERYRILRTNDALPYLSAFAESLPLQAHHTIDVVRGTRKLRQVLARYLAMLSELQKPEEDGGSGLESGLDMDLRGLQFPEDPMMLIYFSAALLQLPPSEKQPLLETDTAALLLEKVQRLFRRELAILPPLLTVSEEKARESAWVN